MGASILYLRTHVRPCAEYVMCASPTAAFDSPSEPTWLRVDRIHRRIAKEQPEHDASPSRHRRRWLLPAPLHGQRDVVCVREHLGVAAPVPRHRLLRRLNVDKVSTLE